jgi:hypothetical protein
VLCCLQEQSPVLRWAPHRSVPSCLVSHLNIVQFQGFQGLQDELLFVKYALRNGLVLEKMIIYDMSLDQKKKNNIIKELSKVRRACGTCQLIFGRVLRCDISLSFLNQFSSCWYCIKSKWLTLDLVCTISSCVLCLMNKITFVDETLSFFYKLITNLVFLSLILYAIYNKNKIVLCYLHSIWLLQYYIMWMK